MGKHQQTEIDADQHNQMHFVRDKLEQFQRNILRDVEKRMTGMIEDVLQDMREHQLKANEFRDFASKTSQQHQITSNGKSTEQMQQQQQQQSSEHRQKNNLWNNRVSRETATVNGCGVMQPDGNLSNGSTKTTTTKTASKEHRSARALPDKVFIMRESYLTALLQVDHMRTIYHIFHIILLILLLNSMCYDYFVEGSIKFGLRTFKSGLNKIQYVFGIWLLEHVFVFSLYYAFSGWATVRQRLWGQSWLQRFWSHSCLIVYIGSQLVFAYVATVSCLRLDLPYVSASVLLLESTRLLMKMHAYVRTNAARVLAGKQKLDEHDYTVAASTIQVRLPTFGSYLYFLFAPTLIYRDSYPRTARIRWQFALARFLEVVAVAFLYSYLHERHTQVHFSKIGLEPLNASMMLVKFFGMLMPGILIFLGGFYLILHAWLNFTAELLRFGDRMFYKDWWTSITYDAYYRNWNVVVHDWLYEYIYKDFYTYVYNGSKLASSLTVFMISAIVHEHIIGVALQFFFPVMFIFFGVIGVLMVFITRRLPKTIGNIFLWFSLITGNGTLISLYAMEFYAQQNCPKTFNTWSDYLTPAILNCY